MVKLKYREIQRMSAVKLEEKLGREVGIVYVDSQAKFEIKVSEGERIPIYNPSKHRVGDKVLVMKNGKYIEMVVPEVDADGRIYEW